MHEPRESTSVGAFPHELHETRSRRSVGIAAILAAVLLGSSNGAILRRAEAPVVTVAFWRLVLASFVWHAILAVRGQRISRDQWRRGALTGVVFGLNITLFFSALTSTSIAHAEIIISLAPIAVVPLGVLLFHEPVPWRAVPWVAVALCGAVFVVGFNPAGGSASVRGDLLALAAVAGWCVVLLSTRRLRADMDVGQLMGITTPIAALTVAPLAISRGGVLDLGWRGWLAALLIAVTTGVIAHGLMMFAQRHLPIALISLVQVAQPALAVTWAWLLIGETIRPMQAVGGLLVLGGLVAFMRVSRRFEASREVPPAIAVE